MWDLPPVVTGDLDGAKDGILVDSETAILPDELADEASAAEAPAGLKVHKWFSVDGNNIVDVKSAFLV